MTDLLRSTEQSRNSGCSHSPLIFSDPDLMFSTGFHVREKAKHILALLKDEQLLHNEREIARRTRRRTSYAMLSPSKPCGKAYAPTTAASDPTSECPPLEKVQCKQESSIATKMLVFHIFSN